MEAHGGQLARGKSKTILQVVGVSDARAKGDNETSLQYWPGQDAFSHQAKLWKQSATRWFTKKGLQEPLNQRPHPKVLEIVLSHADRRVEESDPSTQPPRLRKTS